MTAHTNLAGWELDRSQIMLQCSPVSMERANAAIRDSAGGVAFIHEESKHGDEITETLLWPVVVIIDRKAYIGASRNNAKV